jgi:uncharacterized protein YbaA (DUF1428 family)
MAIGRRHKAKTAKAATIFREFGALAALGRHKPDLT